MRESLYSWLKLLLKFLFSFSILYYMVHTGRLDLTVVSRGFTQVPLLLASVALVITAMIAALYRWSVLLRGLGLGYRFSEVTRYGMIGAFFNTTMPGAVSGDLIKAWYIVSDHKGQKKTPVLSSILLDRAMGVFGLVLVSASPLFFQWGNVWQVGGLHQLAWFILALFMGVVVFFAYILLSVWGPLGFLRTKMDGLTEYKAGRIFLDAYDSWISYGHNPWILVRALALSVCTHVCIVFVVVLCAKALGEDTIAGFQYFLLVPMGLLTTAIPIAPAGLGVGHVAFAALFSLAGSSHGAEIFTMLVTIQIFLNLTGVFFYLRSPKVQPS
jgi:glycosyltransferase 2 family protein